MAGSRKSFTPIILVLIAIGAVAAWYFLRPDPGKAPIDPKRRAELTALAKNTTRGIAHLENHEWAEADAIFLKMATAQPDEVLPVQNLAIARVMRLTAKNSKINPQEDLEEFGSALTAAHDAIGMLQKRDAKSPLAEIMLGELSMKLAALPPSGELGRLRQEFQGSYSEAYSHFEAAAKADSADAMAFFKMHDASQFTRDKTLETAGLEALKQAAELQPENIWVLKTLLAAQATANDPSVLETVKKTREVILPIADRYQQIQNRDLIAAFDRAKKDVENGKLRSVRGPTNMLMGDIAARIDLRRVDRNLLEFIVFDFSDKLQTEIDSPGQGDDATGSPEAATDVKFILANLAFPKLDGVSDIHLVDVDLSTTLEVVVVRGGKVEVYGRSESGDWSLTAKSPELGSISKVAIADLDRDFDNRFEPTQSQKSAVESKQPTVATDTDVDFVAYGPDGAFVLNNVRDDDGTRSLVLTDQKDGIDTIKNVTTTATVDVDHDGDLDLVFATADGIDFRINHGKFRFGSGNANVSKLPSDCNVTSITAVDWDRDVDTDLICTTSDATGVAIFENLTLGRFRFKRIEDFANSAPSEKAIVGDFDGNASWDLVRLPANSSDRVGMLLTSTSRTGSVSVLRSQAKPDFQPAATGFSFDYDNDGRLDLVTWGGGDAAAEFRISRGTAGSFVDTKLAPQMAVVACDAGDIDQDGDLDLVVRNDDGVSFLINEGGNANNSINLTLRSEKNPEQFPSQRVNMHGYASTIEMRAGVQYQAMVVDRPVTHIGLGKQTAADILRIIWTDGAPENIVAPKAGVPILAQQDLKGSCPYLYTWDGSKFVFCTDCAWAAPIGLQQAEGKLMQPREWEYLKIRGDQLQPKDGRYVLQVTEELWEAAYFDQIRLIAVDHPADVDVYSNEKVGPASIAEYKIHTVQNARPPIAARDKHGNDILPLLSKRDGKYHRGYDRRTTQGLAEDQILELDLGDIAANGDKPKSIRLFLTGWLMPTDTSLNIAISQNPDLQSPKPPAIQVPDKNGNWVETIPFCGFPGGKTKTIAIDLTDAFLTDDYRLRLVTQMELKWDAAFFTVNETPVDVKTTNLPMLSANLHYRGFSKMEHDTANNGPEKFDYDSVSTSPKWSPMIGRFTRYGDVSELLTVTDDHMIVIGAGDEVTIEFDAGPDVSDGWQRDFLMYNVGWDKDADLNTVTGQSSEPYPFKSMKSYPPIDGETPTDDGYSEYLRIYQTREQEDWLFRNLIRHQPTKK